MIHLPAHRFSCYKLTLIAYETRGDGHIIWWKQIFMICVNTYVFINCISAQWLNNYNCQRLCQTRSEADGGSDTLLVQTSILPINFKLWEHNVQQIVRCSSATGTHIKYGLDSTLSSHCTGQKAHDYYMHTHNTHYRWTPVYTRDYWWRPHTHTHMQAGVGQCCSAGGQAQTKLQRPHPYPFSNTIYT